MPTHPDGVGGLGYVEVVQARLIAFVFALSILVSASFAEEISMDKRVFDVIYPALAVTVVAELAIILLPPFVFAFRLRACQEKGVSDYGVLAARYVRDFEAKWLNAASAPEEPLLGTPDLQSLADLSNSVGIVRNMRRVPVSMRLATSALVAVLAPMAPLFLFKYPFAVIVQQIFKKLAGM